MTQYTPDDYVDYRMQRARETIGEVQVHIENAFWNTAVNRMYYGCFYAIGALLMAYKIEASSHVGVRQKFGEHFVKTGKFDKKLAKHFTALFDKRNKGDYNDFFDYDEETVLMLYPPSQALIAQVESLLRELN